MSKPWTNADGLQVPFGDYWNDPKNFVNKAKAVDTAGRIRQVIVDVDLARIADGTVSYSADLNNDGTPDGFHDGDIRLPANASVIRTTLVMKTAAVGGTSFIVGLYKKDGSAVDADGLITATEGVIANVNAAGKRVYGAGAYNSATAGTAGIGTANAYIGISPTGTFTAGKGVLIVEYIDPNPEGVAD